MCRRVTWLALLAMVLVLAGGLSGLHAAVRHRVSPCAAMAMAAGHAPAPVHKADADGCGKCGIDCPMHCASVALLPANAPVLMVGRPAYPPCPRPYSAGCLPHAEHGPPRPLA